MSPQRMSARGLPLRCRVGLHAWFLDCGLIRSAYRCNLCGAAQDRDAAAGLAAERERIGKLPGHPSLADLCRAALGLEASQ